MNLDEYQSAAMRFLNDDLPEATKLIHGPLGMANEAGEVLGLYKKHLIYGKPLELAELLKEVGDVLWYAARTAHAHRFQLSDLFKNGVVTARADRLRDILYYPALLNARAALCLDMAETCWQNGMDAHSAGLEVAAIVARCAQVLDRHAVAIGDALEINIHKLSSRYPLGRFVASHAMAKADEK